MYSIVVTVLEQVKRLTIYGASVIPTTVTSYQITAACYHLILVLESTLPVCLQRHPHDSPPILNSLASLVSYPSLGMRELANRNQRESLWPNKFCRQSQRE